MPTDPDHELRRLARAMVADDHPPPIPPWPLETPADGGGSGPWAGRRLLVVAAAVVLVAAAVGGLVALGRADTATPADAPATSVPPGTVSTATPVTTRNAPTTTITSTSAATTAVAPASTQPATSTPANPATSGPPEGVAVPDSTIGPTPCGDPPGQDTEYPLQRCDAGLAVAVLQQELTTQGYLPPAEYITGRFDDQVDAAVRAFQRDHGLAVDGLVGPITWAAITADYQQRVVDPNGDGHIDPIEILVIGDANEE